MIRQKQRYAELAEKCFQKNPFQEVEFKTAGGLTLGDCSNAVAAIRMANRCRQSVVCFKECHIHKYLTN